MTVCLNLLVVVAVKTKPRLQTMYNVLLCASAATGLVVGAVVQPSFIVQEMSLIKGSSLTVCAAYNKVVFLFLAPCLASLSLLALLSIERYLAMKYSLRYQEIKRRLGWPLLLLAAGLSHSFLQFSFIQPAWPLSVCL